MSGEVVRSVAAASAICGQGPQWHYTQCGSAVVMMFTAWGKLECHKH